VEFLHRNIDLRKTFIKIKKEIKFVTCGGEATNRFKITEGKDTL